MQNTKRRVVGGFVAAAAGVSLAACSTNDGNEGDGGSEDTGADEPAAEETTEDPGAFFDGKTITMVVPYNPGGGFDTFLRLLEPRLEEQIEGVSVEVENRPGGGGLIGANEVFNAEPDGLTIGLINYPGAVFAELTEKEGATFSNTEWTHLGRLGALPPLVYTGPDSEYSTFDDMLDSEQPVSFGLGGVGSDAYYVAVALANLYEFPNEIVAGYPGSGEADAALLVGEVDASINSGGAGLQMVQGSGAQPIVMVSTEPMEELPDVPLITEFGDAEQKETARALASIYDLERIMVGPPGMEEARADFLGNAINAAAQDSGYQEEMEQAGYPVNPLPREETSELAGSVSDSVDQLTAVIQE